MSSNYMQADPPLIASDPIYIGPADQTPTLDEEVGRVRIFPCVVVGGFGHSAIRNRAQPANTRRHRKLS